jgi:peptidoglycan/LPS O-acetylase OafA/YrhL
MQYKKEVDGLRAISVISVILFHANFSFFSGGFVGVDIFFVISGYLITGILLREKSAGDFSLAKFYERRARRILPALFFVLLSCLPLAWMWLPPIDMKHFTQSLLSVLFFSSNILFYSSTGYFDTAAEWKPLLHTWSLAVEEQYYVFFPLLLMLTWRLARYWIVIVLVAIATASLIYAQHQSVNNPAAAFYLLPTRAWELLIGAFIAFYSLSKWYKDFSLPIANLGSLLGLLMIGYAIFSFNRENTFTGYYMLIPTLGAALILVFASQETLVGKLLSLRLLVLIGLISYSAYLWHWPLFVFARYKLLPHVPSPETFGILAIASLALGFITWKLIETPFRNRQKISVGMVAACAICANVFFLGFGLKGYLSKGYESRIASASEIPVIDFPWLMNGWCFYQPDVSEQLTIGEKGVACWLGDKESPKKAVLIGDSIAGNYEPFWDKVGKQLNLGINPLTTNYCVPTRSQEWTGPVQFKAKEQCFYNRNYFEKNIGLYDVAILSGNWMDYSAKNKLGDVLSLIDFAAANTKTVVVMAAPVAYDINPMELYNKTLLDKTPFDISQVTVVRDEEQIRANAILEATSRHYKNVIYVDRNTLFAIEDRPFGVTKENIPFTLDGLHLSTYGSTNSASIFLQSQKYKDLVMLLDNHNTEFN